MMTDDSNPASIAAGSTFRDRDTPAAIRQIFLDTLAATRPVLAASEVARGWNEPSALAEFSVRGLAGHLVRAALTLDAYLDRPAPQGTHPISVAAYYATLDPDIFSPIHRGVRERGEDLASAGHERLVDEYDRLSIRLGERLVREGDDRLLAVAGNITMRLDDYLVSRTVELVIHADDLAVSVGLDSPDLPPDARDITIGALVSVARYRHGDLAVLYALARRERDSVDALRVF